ncbi:hypothetical protein ACE41H_24570 [Paenibacillus enshidis]|uniref:Uncharacterized protein n=1 Tax=Paenibacillus enshidis TaxID=1458439 RepID=A0ABV5B0Z0_9BACL
MLPIILHQLREKALIALAAENLPFSHFFMNPDGIRTVGTTIGQRTIDRVGPSAFGHRSFAMILVPLVLIGFLLGRRRLHDRIRGYAG